MAERIEHRVCGCGREYRCDGVYYKEVCPGCLPKLPKYAQLYARTKEQAARLVADRSKSKRGEFEEAA